MKQNLLRRTSTIAEKGLELGVEAYLKAEGRVSENYSQSSVVVKKISEDTSRGIMKIKQGTGVAVATVQDSASFGMNVVSSLWSSFT